MTHRHEIASEAEMEALGARLAPYARDLRLVGLRGDLGAGKTTLVRGLLRALGHRGAVKSPTFTLVEPYVFAEWTLYHFDLYRLIDPNELEFIGLRDYVGEQALLIVEWPEKGTGILPEADIDVIIQKVNTRRHVELLAHNARGTAVLSALP